ncbi:MAG: class I SAM-dependent methyltransferase [Pseudomonadota bacterium]
MFFSQQKAINTSLPSILTSEVKNGAVLAGNDFTGEQLSKWFAQEQEAFYYDNNGNSEVDPWYEYARSLNELLGFSRVPLIKDKALTSPSVLVLGPGSGIEIDNFAKKNSNWRIYFIEASSNFKVELKQKYSKSFVIDAVTSGDILVNNDSQDVVCAFSVLHHVPNVSYVVKEMYRVMKPGGLFLVREPCSSMGDWRYPRSATPNERGISRDLMISIAKNAGFEIEQKPIPILFNPLNVYLKKIGASSLITTKNFYWVDRLFSWLTSFNDHYWRDCWYKKIGPSAYFYVFKKP